MASQQIRNIYTFYWNDVTGLNTLESFINSYLDEVYDAIIGVTVANMVFTEYDVYKWIAPNWSYLGSITKGKTGTEPSEALPNQMAAVLIGKVLGRRGFGRKFFAGFGEGMQDAGSLAATAIASLVNCALAYVSPRVTGGVSLTPGVVDKDHNFHAFTSGVVDTILGTMRRRKIGVGF